MAISFSSCQIKGESRSVEKKLTDQGLEINEIASESLLTNDSLIGKRNISHYRCNELKGEYFFYNPCQRVTFLETKVLAKAYDDACLLAITADLNSISGIQASVYPCGMGACYISDSLFLQDLKKWRNYFECEQN